MGEILKVIYERQLDGDVSSLDEAMTAARAIIASPT
jgi:hypothetical protein